MSENRKLTFYGRHVESLIMLSDVDCLEFGQQVVFPDMATPVTLAVQWSQEEFTEILSSVCMGAYTVYGDEAARIIDTFLKVVGCPMDICTAFTACIESDADTQQALLNFLLTQQGGGYTSTGSSNTLTNPLEQSQLDTNLIPAGWTCDDDHAYGMAVAVIDDIAAAAEGVLNAIENVTDPGELIVNFVDNFEIASWLSSPFEAAFWAQDELKTDYESAWAQTALRDEFYCELYCRIIASCELSFSTLDYFYRSFLPQMPGDINDFQAIVDWALALTINADKTVIALWHWIGLQALRFRSKVNGIFIGGFRSLEQTIANAVDETDNGHTACAGCENWNGMWSKFFTGQWVIEKGAIGANGIRAVTVSPDAKQVLLRLYLPDGYTFNWDMALMEHLSDTNCTGGQGGQHAADFRKVDDGGSVIFWDASSALTADVPRVDCVDGQNTNITMNGDGFIQFSETLDTGELPGANLWLVSFQLAGAGQTIFAQSTDAEIGCPP